MTTEEAVMSVNADRRVAIVTGASRGIGAAIAERLALDGFAVVINYAGSADDANEVVDSILAKGGKAAAVRADVRDATAVTRLFEEARRIFGGVNVLVNNAGIMKMALVANSDDALFDSHVAINLKGAFNTLREAARTLPDGSRIVNLSSCVVGLYQPTYAVYAATKAGVEALTHILMKELRGRNITVNAIAPGPTATDLFFNGKSQDIVNQFARQAPLERLGTPHDIAAAVSFLVGPDGAWINGQVLRANGGII
jgi:3-oxoacyl-[acyl-carrier protein] reductase